MFRNAATAVIVLALFTNASLADSNLNISTSVSFSDLDLSQQHDAQILAGRIQTAAERVCLNAYRTELAEKKVGQQAVDKCVDAAVKIALTKVEYSVASKIHATLVEARQQQSR